MERLKSFLEVLEEIYMKDIDNSQDKKELKQKENESMK